LKDDAQYGTLWRIRFGRDYWLVVRQTTEWKNEDTGYCLLASKRLNVTSSSTRSLHLYESLVFPLTCLVHGLKMNTPCEEHSKQRRHRQGNDCLRSFITWQGSKYFLRHRRLFKLFGWHLAIQ
jgi:hypothetical protein